MIEYIFLEKLLEDKDVDNIFYKSIFLKNTP